MRWLIYVLVAIWILPIVAAIPRFWYFQIILLNNRGSDKKARNGGFFDSSGYNALGRATHERMLWLWWRVVAWGITWPIVIEIIGSWLFEHP